MTELDEEEEDAPLIEHRLGRTGLVAKLDKGFQPGVYGFYVEYGALADQIGFTPARRQALAYAARLHGHLARTAGYTLDATADASQSDDARRKHDLEGTFLSAAMSAVDGNWHDAGVAKHFRTALLRADQEWDQHRAGMDERRRDGRRERFRQRLAAVLDDEKYRHVDAATKEHLLADMMGLVFPPRGHEL